MSTELTKPTEMDVEYVRLLRVAAEALTTARMYREKHGGWRPAFSDLILLDSLVNQADGENSWWPVGTADTAMAAVVANGQGIEIPEVFWEFIDNDIQEALDNAGVLARETDEVCSGCGKRWPEGTGEVIECENDGCTGACPNCEDKPCPKAVQA